MIRSQERLFILWGIADDPTWPGLEALGGQLEAGHQADGGGQAGRPGAGLHERGDHVEVERAGVHLADVGERGLEAEVAGHRRLELRDLARPCPSRSSMSCWVPTGPLIPRSG